MKFDKDVQKLEMEIYKAKEKLAKMRSKRPLEKISDYEFFDGKKKVKLSQLFGTKNELIVIHNMGFDCPYCALWADGFNGFTPHLEDRAAFVLENDETPAVQARVKKQKGWNFRIVSSEKSSFKKDMGVRKGDDYMPGVSTFVKNKKGEISRVAVSYFGPGDNYCSIWDLFNLLPNGSGDWGPKWKY